MSEIYVSAVLGRPVIDPAGVELGRLEDLRLVPGELLPLVSGLFIRNRGKRHFLPWGAVTLFTPVVVSARADGLRVEDAADADTPDIRLRRDVLDRQIVDVDGAKVVRVNDLKLRTRGANLFVEAVDVGIRGMARRLGQLRFWNWLAGVFGAKLPFREINWRFVAPLDLNADRLTLTVARERLTDLHPADIAEILAQLPHKEVGTVLGSLDPETVSEAIGELDPELGGRVISQLDSEQASDILEEMEPHEAADLLGDLPEEKAQELLGLMDADDAEMVQELLEHEEDTAGGLMNNLFAFVPPAMDTEYVYPIPDGLTLPWNAAALIVSLAVFAYAFRSRKTPELTALFVTGIVGILLVAGSRTIPGMVFYQLVLKKTLPILFAAFSNTTRWLPLVILPYAILFARAAADTAAHWRPRATMTFGCI